MSQSSPTNPTPVLERSEGNPVGEIFRQATRPIVTIIFAAAIAQIAVERIDAPEWFIGLAVPVVLWWFGERTATHIKEKSTQKPQQTQ
jgi:hypothetical protein